VADRFDLRGDIQLDTRVEAATFNKETNDWTIRTDKGTARAPFCIMATGCLSSTNTPNFKGKDSFAGATYHTGKWPHENVDFTGKRVGIIGTGSSGIQSVPVIAEQAAHLYVFQRTPNFSVPARNMPMDPEFQRRIKADYRGFRENLRDLPIACMRPPGEESALEATPQERQAAYEEAWQRGGLSFLGTYSDLITNKQANDTAAEFVRAKIHEIVDDPLVADMLSPDHVIGCKRPCSDSGYYEAFNRSNVTLIDLTRTPLDAITPAGIKTTSAEYDLDCIVFATGFDAMTGSLNRIDIRGRDGQQLKEKWAPGPATYLGLQTVGFPNLFTITGPGSPSVLANMVTGVEQHAEWISDCIAYIREHGYERIEPTAEAEQAWVIHVNEVADTTLYPTCNSWYMGANIPGKSRVFLPYIGGFPTYERKCKEVVANDYEGFAFS
ncbi:MAG: NAD(P)/FAD-dependent oxidoreductase, partial [Gammaproteobacteria bacterium]